MQEFKKPGELGFIKQEPIKVKGPDLQLPDPHEAAKLAGLKDLDLEALERELNAKDQEQEGAAQQGGDQEGAEQDGQQARGTARKGKRRRLRPLCFCGVRGCGIGAFTKYYEEEEDVEEPG
jgi:hypothetical protein